MLHAEIGVSSAAIPRSSRSNWTRCHAMPTSFAHLCRLGLKRIDRCRLTRNRNVMVSFRGRDLRIHEAIPAPRDDGGLSLPKDTRASTRGAGTDRGAHGRDATGARRERTRPRTSRSLRRSARHARCAPSTRGRWGRSPFGFASDEESARPLLGGEPRHGEIAISWRHSPPRWDDALRTLCTRWCTSGRTKQAPDRPRPCVPPARREVGIAAARRVPG
jgi:hypothetical protein